MFPHELTNKLQQKRVARECAEWIENKVDIKTVKQSNLLHGKMYRVANAGVEDAILGSSNFTVRGLGLGTFASYQKVILTHDLGFFREFRRRISRNHCDWRFVRLQGNAAQNIETKNEKGDLEKAEDYLNGHDVEEAAMFLRKAAEDTAKRYREWAEGKALPPGQFFSLTENLRAARKKLLEGIPVSVYEKVLKGTPKEYREILVSDDDTDLDSNATLQPGDRGKLKSKRRDLRNVLKHDGWAKMEAVEAVDRVLEMTERVLNPASHGNATPLYEEEVRRAKKLIDRLEKALLEAQKCRRKAPISLSPQNLLP